MDDILNALSVNEGNRLSEFLPNMGSNLTSLDPWMELLRLDTKVRIPESAYHVFDNDYFAHMRVAGYNPVVIKIVIGELPAKFPVADRMFKSVDGFQEDSLANAIAQGRVFICDYEILERLTPGKTSFSLKRVTKYVYAPIALFAVRKGGDKC